MVVARAPFRGAFDLSCVSTMHAAMPDSEEVRGTALAEAIVRYLTDHPDAADSLRGIRQWWLGARFLDVSDTHVRSTLEDLVQARRIACTRLPDGTEVYSGASSRGRQYRQ